MMKLLGSTKSKINKDENGENDEIIEVALVHYNIFDNKHQQTPIVLYTAVPNKLFGQFLDI